LTPLLDFLKAREDVFIIGPDDPTIRSSTVTIVPLEKSVEAVATELEKQKLMVASGDFDATRIFKDMNIEEDPGAIRLSFVHYTTQHDIDRLISGLAIALG
jgi:selenocysteine lyase/cysteine desulfurase